MSIFAPPKHKFQHMNTHNKSTKVQTNFNTNTINNNKKQKLMEKTEKKTAGKTTAPTTKKDASGARKKEKDVNGMPVAPDEMWQACMKADMEALGNAAVNAAVVVAALAKRLGYDEVLVRKTSSGITMEYDVKGESKEE